MGLLGIVTSITYELDEMSYARLVGASLVSALIILIPRYQPHNADGGLPAVLPPPGKDILEDTIRGLNNYFSEFIGQLQQQQQQQQQQQLTVCRVREPRKRHWAAVGDDF